MTPLEKLRYGLMLGAIPLVILVVRLQPAIPFHFWALSVVFGLALIAELRPVHFTRSGVFLCFSMPYIAGALLVAGPVWALLCETAVLLAATAIQTFVGGQKRQFHWASFNIPIAAISSSMGGLLFILIAAQNRPLIAVAAFVITYLITNTLLVAWVNSLSTALPFGKEIAHGLLPTLAGGAAYLLLALSSAILASVNAYWGLLLLLIPVLLLRNIAQKFREIDDLEFESIVGLMLMLSRAHPYTHGHLERVGRIAENVSLKLGLSRYRAKLVREAAVLHDIGKIALNEQVLDKPSRLSDDEYTHVKQHAAFGAEILATCPRYHEVVNWIRHHHERPDGSGYPMRLTAVEIPIESKIIAVVDAYDAMTGEDEGGESRSYRESLSRAEAFEELNRCAGTQFDPLVVGAFIEVIQGAST